MTELLTDRLLLRRWRDSDFEPFAALTADPEVMRYFPAPLDREASDSLAARADGLFETQGFGLWALELRATGEFIGFTGLAPMPDGVPGSGGVEVGWRLAREFWGVGYASEAARASVRFGFDEVGLTEIDSITAVLNLRSQAVMERIGMRRADFFGHPRVAVGSPLRPHVRYRLAAE
ncbi:GNAT family N-acetyltransferase [Herbiconiux sp. P17]|uniref:GNAT family N-acetyltransferase n=1 Tax=Herbiconiux wuyangfengii TaxID=3342794 RepID=UPI0035B7CF54